MTRKETETPPVAFGVGVGVRKSFGIVGVGFEKTGPKKQLKLKLGKTRIKKNYSKEDFSRRKR